LEKNIDTFFNYVNLNLCNFIKEGGAQCCKGGFQNGKHGFLMQYLIGQSFEGYCCEAEYTGGMIVLYL